jgi:hypothetical protein
MESRGSAGRAGEAPGGGGIGVVEEEERRHPTVEELLTG